VNGTCDDKSYRDSGSGCESQNPQAFISNTWARKGCEMAQRNFLLSKKLVTEIISH